MFIILVLESFNEDRWKGGEVTNRIESDEYFEDGSIGYVRIWFLRFFMLRFYFLILWGWKEF